MMWPYREVRRFLILTLFAGAVANLAQPGERRLTLSEAEQLVRAALDEEATHSVGLRLEPPPVPPKKGAMFNVEWTEPTSGTSRARWFLVDIDTGEVWEPGACEAVATSSLERAQGAIRRRLKVQSQDVTRARDTAKKNGCSNLIDTRPKRSNFHPAKLISVSGGQKSTGIRYTVMLGGCHYVGSSRVAIKIEEGGDVPFAIIGREMFAIDGDGLFRELRYESVICADETRRRI